MRITVLCGLPGAGKTFTRLTDPDLADLPTADIKDVYQDWPEADWAMAQESLIRRYRKLLRQNPHIVVEGCFMPGSAGRRRLEADARVGGYEIEYRLIEADPVVCYERIMAEFGTGEIDWPEANIRIRILRSMTG